MMRGGWIPYFASNPVAANLLMLLILVGGVAAGSRLAVENYPEFDLRTVAVRVVSPGASPREVEEDIVRRIEESVIGLPGVDRVVSTSREGLGTIEIELTTFANEDQVLDDVQQAVDGLENFPPLGAEQPEVELVQLNLEAITLAVSSAVLDETDLRHAAEDVRRELQQLPSTSRVDLSGTRDREISIELSEEELRRHGLSLGGRGQHRAQRLPQPHVRRVAYRGGRGGAAHRRQAHARRGIRWHPPPDPPGRDDRDPRGRGDDPR